MEIGESTKLLVPNIRETVENEELGVLLDFFQQQHPSDSAELFEELETEAVAEIDCRLTYPRTVLNQVFDLVTVGQQADNLMHGEKNSLNVGLAMTRF